jgi:YHS domain-containing protein
MATDPVCFMPVDEDSAQFTSDYKGTEYYFCTAWCKKKFDENPERYRRMAHTIDLDPGMTC